jgi:DNA-binding FadR family transcriptional regulator
MSVVRLAVEKATEDNIRNFHDIFASMEKNRESQNNFLADDMRFHLELAKCTQNSTLASLVETFYSIIDKKLFLVSQLYPQRSVQAQKEHWNMIAAIESHDAEALVASMKAHMECIRTQLQDQNS